MSDLASGIYSGIEEVFEKIQPIHARMLELRRKYSNNKELFDVFTDFDVALQDIDFDLYQEILENKGGD